MVYPRDQYSLQSYLTSPVIIWTVGAEWILSQSVIDTKLGGIAEMPEGPAAVTQEGLDLDRLENWTGRNLMEFNTDKYKVLNLGRDSPTHHLCWGCPATEQLCRKCSAKCGPGGH